MKYKKCPKCGNKDLGDRWTCGRKLEQYCHGNHDSWDNECNWVGKARTPELIPITNTKDLRIDDFCGWDFTMYDKFGHTITMSRTYDTKDKALKELEEDLKRGEKDKDAGPYTAVLFKTPSSVVLKGKIFRVKNGVVTQTKV